MLVYALFHSETSVLKSRYFLPGKIFLSAIDIWSQLLSFNGMKLNQTSVMNHVPSQRMNLYSNVYAANLS